ncbi:response regulator [Thermus sp.]
MRVLVVDDEPFMGYLMGILLLPLGHQVDAVFSGEEALECLEREVYDLVFCDLVMPGIGGLETIRRIRLRGGPPVIALSATVSPDWQQEALRAGAAAFLGKPFTRGDLLKIVAQIGEGGDARNSGSG